MIKKQKVTFIDIIKTAGDRLDLPYKKFTWHSLAKKLKISKSYLSQILSGKKNFPADRLDLLIEMLELDELGRHNLLTAFVEEELQRIQVESKYCKQYFERTGFTNEIQNNHLAELNVEAMDLFDHWYHTALLDLVQTVNFKLDFKWIATRLNISVTLAEMSWNFLLNKGYVVKAQSNKWEKVQAKFRMVDGDKPRPSEKEIIKTRLRYYSQMMEKAKAQILEGSASKNQRLIQGLTCSINQSKLPTAKVELEKALYSAAEDLTEGECSEVYYLMTMAIPLTSTKV
jgi:uncharacterized protein (TIGR02147 family)